MPCQSKRDDQRQDGKQRDKLDRSLPVGIANAAHRASIDCATLRECRGLSRAILDPGTRGTRCQTRYSPLPAATIMR